MNIEITNLVREASTGVVLQVYWKATLENNDGVSATIHDISVFESTPETDGFIPYDKLTQDTVQKWLPLDNLENRLLAKLEAKSKKNVYTENGLPWFVEPA